MLHRAYPECMTHLIGNAAFVGDTLFMPDGGTARADSRRNAKDLYKSIKKILSLPEDTKFLFACYMPKGRSKMGKYSKEQKNNNIHVNKKISKNDFVKMRNERTHHYRSKTYASVNPVNIRAGYMPPKENNGDVYLKIPLKGLKRF